MRILSVDTSSKICSVSILEDNNTIIEKNNNEEKTHSQKLMPLINEVFQKSNLNLDNIDLLACCIGPGSFTGIRIGVSTIKAFADTKNIPAIGVTSLEGLAYNVNTPGIIATIIDAKNNNVYFGLFNFSNGIYTQIGEFLSDNISNVLILLEDYCDTPITFIGDGCIVHKHIISTKFENSIFVEEKQNLQSSISIGKCALNKYKEKKDLGLLSPVYLKKSQAERFLNGEN